MTEIRSIDEDLVPGPSPATRDDEGAILVMVLVMMVIGALIILPLMVYTISVFRAGSVQTDKSEAVELARGGTWVALSNEADLYDKCTGVEDLSDALDTVEYDVETRCTLVDDSRLRPAAEIPYHVVTTRSDVGIPPQIVAPVETYSPNSTAPNPDDWDKWADGPEWSSDSAENTVWLPELPVRSTLGGGVRDTAIGYNPGCRVFFPGTFQNPITIDGTAYFTSGVYYFTEPITLAKGADVVVGNGTALGCTSDFEAVAESVAVPNPLNISGLGGTFVFGDDARIIIDDLNGPGAEIKFNMNQRYVSPEETSVAASSNVAIATVNGTHAPLLVTETLGDDLIVDGVIHVPASTVGTGDPVSPAAVDEGYTPSNLTNKMYSPDAPTNVVANDYQRSGPGADGRMVVTWDAPDDNGSPITGYTVSDANYGHSCTPLPPISPDTSVQTSCIITGISHQGSGFPRLELTVTATNALGTSPPSPNLTAPRVDLSGGSQSPVLQPPDKPVNVVVPNVYSDGLEFSWDPPADDGGAPISGYRVTAKVPGPGGALVDSCEAWWDETSCVLLGLTDSTMYHIDVVALQTEGPPNTEFESPHAHLGTGADLWVLFAAPGNDAPPDLPTVVSTIRIPEPILGLTTSTATPIDIEIAGYISAPQGRIEIGVDNTANSEVELHGGVVVGDIMIDPGREPGLLNVELRNPIAQKRVRISTTVTGDYDATSVAIVQVNRSGSIAVNSWFVQ